MKRILLTMVAACLIIQANAQLNTNYKYEWGKLFGASLNESPGSVKASSDGNLFLFGNFVSSTNKGSVETKYGDAVITGAPDSTTGGNTNMFLYKIDPAGKLLWCVHSDMGSISLSSSSMAPTSDGGAILALKVKMSKGVPNPGKFLSLADGEDNPLWIVPFSAITNDPNTPYIGVLVRVKNDGSIAWAETINVVQSSEKDVLDLNAVAEDAEGNFYLGGAYKDDINIFTAGGGRITLEPRSASGDMFLMKLNNKGELIWDLTTSGDAMLGESIDRIIIQDQLILLGATVKGDGTSKMQFGNTEITPTADTDMLLASVNPDKTVNWVKHCPVSVAKGNANPYALLATGNELYVAGKFAKGFKVENTEVTSWKNSAGTDYNQGFMMKCAISDGKLAYLNSVTGAFAELWGIHKVDNSIFCSGYYSNAWGVNSTEYTDTDFGNGIIIAKDASGTANNKGDILLATYDATTGKALYAENIVQGAAMENCGGGSEMIGNQIFVYGLSQSSPVTIGGNSFTGNGGFDGVIASFTLDSKTGIDNVNQDSPVVIYAANGQLYIKSETAITDVNIYSAMGSLLSKYNAVAGMNLIEMPAPAIKGVGIVQIRAINGETKAVKVKF